ncbi:MAG: HAMP domain-containing protein, partial [Gemmatimonadetes bacterium]|nr:HAMP domain-containing protein [Gemmatimonadota bacterium]
MGGLLRGLSLRRKLTLLNVISSGGALLLAGLAYGLLEEHAARNALVRELGLQADFLALELGPAAGFGDATSLEAMLRRGIELPDLVGGRVFGPGGRTLALVGEAPSTLSETGHRFVPGGLEISRPIVSDGEIVAWLAVQSDLASLQPRRVTLIQNGVAVLFLAMLVSYLVSLFLQKQLTRRTEALADAVMRVSEGEGYAVRVTDHENDEIGKFIRAFNGMLEQIEARDAALREAHDHLELHVEERTHALKEEIARRAEVEEELIRSRDTAEAASRAKAEFVANMSHEIRTPLIGVIGMADLLADTELDDDQRDFTDTLRRSGGHLLTLVNDILDYSRIEENRIEL